SARPGEKRKHPTQLPRALPYRSSAGSPVPRLWPLSIRVCLDEIRRSVCLPPSFSPLHSPTGHASIMETPPSWLPEKRSSRHVNKALGLLVAGLFYRLHLKD